MGSPSSRFPRHSICPLLRANSDSVCASHSKHSSVSRRHHGSAGKAGRWITRAPETREQYRRVSASSPPVRKPPSIFDRVHFLKRNRAPGRAQQAPTLIRSLPRIARLRPGKPGCRTPLGIDRTGLAIDARGRRQPAPSSLGALQLGRVRLKRLGIRPHEPPAGLAAGGPGHAEALEQAVADAQCVGDRGQPGVDRA